MEILNCLIHPDETLTLLKYKFLGKGKLYSDKESPAMRRCYELLVQTSRSFPDLIMDMSQKTRNTICLAHLAIRSLDTIEDDMTIEDSVKKPLLRTLYQKLEDPNWNFRHSKDKDNFVLEEFHVITKALKETDSKSKDFVMGTLKIMGEGMAAHKVTEIGTFDELNEYSHWSSGAIMQELERFYSNEALEDPLDNEILRLADIFGIFFQKVDNIKDYLEDLHEGRQLWPTEVWSKYTSKLSNFAESPSPSGCLCINELTLDSLKMVPDCLKYVFRHRNYGHFRFVAIRLCLLTLSMERCYNNPAVFTTKVKARKAEIIKIINFTTDKENVKAVMCHLIKKIRDQVRAADPCGLDTLEICDEILNLCATTVTFNSYNFTPFLYATSASLIALVAASWSAKYTK